MSVRILRGDCREVLRSLPDGSAHCVVTSPPYYGLRDYGVEGQIGLEATPAKYVEELVGVFREVRRVLRDDGTLWLNLGDSYANDGKWGGSSSGKHAAALHGSTGIGRLRQSTGAKPKDLLGIPWRVAFALQADGWWLRSDIIWHKPNPMPESITDRPTSAHEHVFLLAKREQYFFDADAVKESSVSDHVSGNGYGRPEQLSRGGRGQSAGWTDVGGKRNVRNVWTIATAPFPEAHFATFPPDLIEPCILAGTSERGCCPSCGAPWVRQTKRLDQGWDGSRYGERAVAAAGGAKSGGTAASTLGSSNGKMVGQTKTVGWAPSCQCDAATVPCVVLDPFGGAGTTGLVADRLGRNAVLVELNPEYVAMAERRLLGDGGLFMDIAAQ